MRKIWGKENGGSFSLGSKSLGSNTKTWSWFGFQYRNQVLVVHYHRLHIVWDRYILEGKFMFCPQWQCPKGKAMKRRAYFFHFDTAIFIYIFEYKTIDTHGCVILPLNFLERKFIFCPQLQCPKGIPTYP